MYHVYVLQSESDFSYYIGHTSELADRLKRHNEGRSKYTKKNRPWKLVYSEEYRSRGEAMKREKRIKSFKGGEAFKKLLKRGIQDVPPSAG